MLSHDAELDEKTLKRVLASGHSRIPVYASDNRSVFSSRSCI